MKKTTDWNTEDNEMRKASWANASKNEIVRKRKGNRKVNMGRKTVTETTQHWVHTICCRLYTTLKTVKCCFRK